MRFVLWRKISGLPDDRIVRIATSDNFWAMGDTGPCGPCSEIFYDHGDQYARRPAGLQGRGWRPLCGNLEPGVHAIRPGRPDNRVDLPKPCIDTGMGLERMAAVLQGTHDNYQIDLLRPLIDASADVYRVDADGEKAVSHRVIADHLRASELPHRRRGYALERRARLRASPDHAPRHASRPYARRQGPLMHRLVPVLVNEMGGAYPELLRARGARNRDTRSSKKSASSRCWSVVSSSSTRLWTGSESARRCRARWRSSFTTPTAFRSISPKMPCAARAATVDLPGFNNAMARQRAEARKAWAGSGRRGDRGGVVRFARASRCDGISRLRRHPRRGQGRGHSVRTAGPAAGHRRGGGRDRGQPDAVLRRIRWPDR